LGGFAAAETTKSTTKKALLKQGFKIKYHFTLLE
jgi:hypothetical protein